MSDRIGVLVIGMFVCILTHAAEPIAASSASGDEISVDVAHPLSQHTDVQLTELAARWESLDNDQRRALLTEVKHRMAADKAKEPIITIKTRRRYGRTYRRADGALVRIETTEQVLRYHRPSRAADDKQAFGMGFERRVANGNEGSPPPLPRQPDVSAPPATAPVINVSSDSP